MTMANLLLGCLYVLVSYQAVIAEGDCRMDQIAVQPQFDLQKFLNKWYEIKWIPESWFPPEFNWEDFLHFYTINDSNTIDVFATGREKENDDKCIVDEHQLKVTDEPGKFLFTRKHELDGIEYPHSDYWVVMTDYNHYALVYGCRRVGQDGVCTHPDSWVWSRTPTLDKQYEDLMDARILELCLTLDQFFITDHNEECPTSHQKTKSKNEKNGSSRLLKMDDLLRFLLFVLASLISVNHLYI